MQKIMIKKMMFEPYFLVSKFWKRKKLSRNCAFPQNFHKKKSGEIVVFHAVLFELSAQWLSLLNAIQ